MVPGNRRAYWLEVAGLALVAVALFRFGLLMLVFMVPIQLVWIRRGEQAGLVASGVFLAGLSATKLVDLVRLGGVLDAGAFPAGLLLIDIAVAAGLLGGLFVLNSPRMVVPDGREVRSATVPERLLISLGAAVVVYMMVVGVLATGGRGDAFVALQVELLRRVLPAAQASEAEMRALTAVVVSIVLSGLLVGHLLILAGSWWLGVRIAFKSRLPLPEGNAVMARLAGHELTEFRLPAGWVWGLIGGWAMVLVAMLRDVGAFAYVAWNAALVMLALYAIQGVAIVASLFDRHRVRRAIRIAIGVGLFVALLVPGLNLVVLLGLPGLGVSETWVNYHRFDESEGET